MAFIANFIRFQQCKKFENRLRFDKVRDSLKVGRFLRHSVYAPTNTQMKAAELYNIAGTLK